MFHQFVSFCIRLFRRNRLPELAAGAPSGSLRQQRCLGFKQAADSLGVSVARVRYTTVIIGGSLAGAAGAALAIELGIFQQNITNAQGFIAIALVYFGAWRPLGIMLGSLLYGLVNAMVLQLKTLGIIDSDWSDIAAMAPAIITIVALVLVAQRFRQPSALTKPFIREA